MAGIDNAGRGLEAAHYDTMDLNPRFTDLDHLSEKRDERDSKNQKNLYFCVVRIFVRIPVGVLQNRF